MVRIYDPDKHIIEIGENIKIVCKRFLDSGMTPEHYLKTPEEMKALFSDLPEAIQNTVQIAKRSFFLAGKKKPAFPNYDCQGKTEDEALREMAEKGFA